jgi:beta-glucosidase
MVEDWVDNPNVTAVLHAGVPGQETGNAGVDALFSDSPQATNPSWRLPYTIAKARDDSPADVLYTSIDGMPQITYKEELGVDDRCVYSFCFLCDANGVPLYRWFDIKNITPRFEFGFGLRLTTFGYSGSPRRKALSSRYRPCRCVFDRSHVQ